MADESEINQYTLSVRLPRDESSPADVTFKVIFNCNSTTYTSDSIALPAEALAWAESELADFGDWSLDGNILILENSLCGVGSLGIQVTAS